MAQNLKQFNFKLPESLLKQLDKLAETKGVTKTELVIQGIQQVLGIPIEKSHSDVMGSDIYEYLYRLEKQLQESIDYQSAMDLAMNKRIKALEKMVKDLQYRLYISDIASSAEIIPVKKTPVPHHDIVDDIVPGLDTKKEAEDSVNIDIDKNIANYIDDSVELGQLELVRIESDDKDLMEKSKVIDSVEMLKALRLEDPQGKWDNERLTGYRRSKNLKDKWHRAGNLRFKYTGESQQVPNSKKTLYLWFLYQPERI